jgi:hypothetical protein
MHNFKDLLAPGGTAAATEANRKPPAFPLCRMFTFLSQRNKKSTSFH